MSRNIKEIGKELMGKSLNSFHRKTGFTQLEKNNEMQDGILDGILSQVDDAYIEKTEQSNVIHLEGSGDGVVVLDSIEGNTMVNMVKSYDSNNFLYDESQKLDNQYFKLQHSANENSSSVRVKYGNHIYKPNTTYTLVVDIKENTANARLGVSGINSVITKFSSVNFSNLLGQSMITFVTKDDFSTDARGENPPTLDLYFCSWDKGGDLSKHITFRYWILEGDWTNKEIPPYFEGLQSSFEEKVNNEGKYEIEILSVGKNLFDKNTMGTSWWVGSDGIHKEESSIDYSILVPIKNNTTYVVSCGAGQDRYAYALLDENYNTILFQYNKGKIVTNEVNAKYLLYYMSSTGLQNLSDIQLECGSIATKYIPYKQNKIKLLLNEPLRSVGDVRDRLCVKDGKLVIEKRCENLTLDNTQEYGALSNMALDNTLIFRRNKGIGAKNYANHISDKLPSSTNSLSNVDVEGTYIFDNTLRIRINRNKLATQDLEGFKKWIASNPIEIVYELEEPVYEEVLNEYGEPILLEGCENGTIYIDSTIVPTTTVRYTPKMESFKTLKEVENNNIMLTNDVNDNIIPYMMDVDMMILEKEMALMSHQYKLRRTGESDMTSMQKRTQDMLERLIKGKTLTEQECKTRVTTYLNAGKITDTQAKELNFLIDEIYA